MKERMTEDRVHPATHIRWMIRRDMPEVMSIEQASFAFPWDEEHFIQRLRQRNCIGMTTVGLDERGEETSILGFMVYELRKRELGLLNLAVSPTARRAGIGRGMVEKLVGKLDAQRRSRLEVLVPETYLAAQLFFRSCGLRATGIEFAAFVDSSGEDVDGYRFEYRKGRVMSDGED